MIRYGDPRHPWPCPASVGHTTCTCEPEPPTLDEALDKFRQAVLDALRVEALVAWLQAFLVQPGRHRGQPRPVAEPVLATAAVLAVLATYLFLVGVLS